MRHLKTGRKFGRVRNQRKALLNGLATAFFTHKKIKTTEAKAKELRPFVEKCITRAKRPTLANQRGLLQHFSEPVVAHILVEAHKHINRAGGYTRITKIGPRASDNARMAYIEMIQE
ncbi:MAG: 50S ribosomal protein L17 [Candidatus Sungbacteria bacterium]|nr:50S ribosomal protein L17 [Candidatus Sungbacteria bacterium]